MLEQIINMPKNLFPLPQYNNPLWEMLYNGYQVNINEGIFRTYPIETMKSYIQKIFGLDDSECYIHYGENPNSGKIVVSYNNTETNKSLMKRAMELGGFVLSKSINNDSSYVEMYIPRHMDNINDIVKKWSRIFHLTPSYNKEKILSNGFCPKSKSKYFDYPDRIHFFGGNVDRKEIIWQAFDYANHNDSKGNNREYTLFSIDTAKIPENVIFSYDPNQKDAIYTYDNISPDCIIAHVDFNVDEIFNVIFKGL